MYLSQLTRQQALELSDEQKTRIVYSHDFVNDDSAEVAVLLGGAVHLMKTRAYSAYELYRDKRVKKIIPTGEMRKQSEFGYLTEAEIMKSYLVGFGVKEEDILLEPQAKTTVENMIFSALTIYRKYGEKFTDSVIIVTSAAHVNRAVRLAKMYMPSFVKISGYPRATEHDSAEVWMKDEKSRASVDWEVALLWEMARWGRMDDVEL